MAESNGKGILISSSILSGVIVAAGSLLYTQLETTRKDASIALDVVAQHGQEFNEVRADIRELRTAIASATAQLQLGGRFTNVDGDKLRLYIERVEQRLMELERFERAMHSNHLEGMK